MKSYKSMNQDEKKSFIEYNKNRYKDKKTSLIKKIIEVNGVNLDPTKFKGPAALLKEIMKIKGITDPKRRKEIMLNYKIGKLEPVL